MLRYFVAGNLWLLAAVVLLVCGRPSEDRLPGNPSTHEYLIFGVGRLPEDLYALLVIGCLVLAVGFFFLTWWTKARRA